MRPEYDVAAQLPAALELDPDMFIDFLAEIDWTEEQKIEALQLVWSLARSWVELGFEGEMCEQVFGYKADE
jgi:hypothetical protein